MNVDILKRIVGAIADGSQGDLDSLARKVVGAERESGHGRLADELDEYDFSARSRGRQYLANPSEFWFSNGWITIVITPIDLTM